MPKMYRKEIDLVEDLIQRIKDDDRPSWARKVHGSLHSQAGEPDIDACVRGRAVKIEVKLPGERPTPVQYAALRRWQRAGALAGWCDSKHGLEELLRHVEDYGWVNPQLMKDRPVDHFAT